jgi:hypothetical protein
VTDERMCALLQEALDTGGSVHTHTLQDVFDEIISNANCGRLTTRSS